MKVTVLIHRQTKNEPQTGTLRAWVVTPFFDAGGKTRYRRGEQLLARHQFSDIDSAVSHCDAAILALFKLLDTPQIEYVIEDWMKVPLKPIAGL